MYSLNIWNKAKRNRQYPQTAVGDDVRVNLIKESKKPKATILNGQTTYKTTFVKYNDYMVIDGKRKVYQRFELLKVLK